MIIDKYKKTLLNPQGFYPEIEIMNIKKVISKILLNNRHLDSRNSDTLFLLDHGALDIINSHNVELLKTQLGQKE